MPEVSVIIPTYNRAKYVSQAIDSVLAQTYKDYEIIVVDDGSKDNTRQVLEAYKDKIIYLYQENAGVSAARNAGIKAAKGEWMAFLDSDDRWLPDKLLCQMEYINHSETKVCFTNVIYVGKSEQLRQGNQRKRVAMRGEIFAEPFELILDNSHRLYVQTMLIERNLLGQVGYFDENLTVAEDTKLIFQLAFKVPFAYIDLPLVKVNRTKARDGLTNESSNARRQRCETGSRIVAEAYFRCHLKRKSVIKGLRHMLGYYLSVRAVICCVDGNKVDARRFAWDGCSFGGNLRTYIRCVVSLGCPRLVKWVCKRAWS